MPIVKTAKLGPFLGENNRLKRHALQMPESGAYLAATTNVDIDVTGRISRANGATLVSAMTTGRSLFSDGVRTLYADGTELRRITSFSPFAASVVGTVAAAPIAYAESNGEVFYSDNLVLRCLSASNTVRAVGVPVPVSLSAAAIAGSLQGASYQVTISYYYGAEQGGAYPSVSIELATTGGIRLALPPAPAGVTAVAAYVSGPNGEAPLFYGSYSPSTATVDITTAPTGRACLTQLKGPMPAGEHLAIVLGRLFSASGNALYYSDPYNYGLTTPAKNYLQFPEAITNLASCKNGIYVTAGKTWWVTSFGDPLGDPVLPYGAVERTVCQIPNENKVVWLSERGVVIGDSQGQVKNVQEKNLFLSLSGAGASMFVEGNNRIIATNG